MPKERPSARPIPEVNLSPTEIFVFGADAFPVESVAQAVTRNIDIDGREESVRLLQTMEGRIRSPHLLQAPIGYFYNHGSRPNGDRGSLEAVFSPAQRQFLADLKVCSLMDLLCLDQRILAGETRHSKSASKNILHRLYELLAIELPMGNEGWLLRSVFSHPVALPISPASEPARHRAIVAQVNQLTEIEKACLALRFGLGDNLINYVDGVAKIFKKADSFVTATINTAKSNLRYRGSKLLQPFLPLPQISPARTLLSLTCRHEATSLGPTHPLNAAKVSILGLSEHTELELMSADVISPDTTLGSAVCRITPENLDPFALFEFKTKLEALLASQGSLH